MDSGPLRATVERRSSGAGGQGGRTQRGSVRVHARVIESMPDEPVGVVIAGPEGEARRTLLSSLLGGAPLPAVPDGLLVMRYGEADTSAVAHIPGHQQPQPIGNEDSGAVLPRPPRRVELTLPDPLLRHHGLIDTPETGTLGLAGVRVVTSVARRAGAMLFVIRADRRPVPADLDLLTAVAGAGVTVFFAVVPGPHGWPAPPRQPRGLAAAAALHREVVARAVPALDGADWFAVDPFASDTTYLRRALAEWAAWEGLRRAGDNPPVADGATRTVRVPRTTADPDWVDRLDRLIRGTANRLRQQLALELANIHLRCVQQIVFGPGCAGLPAALDREVEALSLLAVADGDAAVAGIVDEAFAMVFGEAPDEGVRRRVAAAVRRGFADHPAARDLDRVLLVTGTGGVATVVGLPAVAAQAGYPLEQGRAILPPWGIALSEGCYQAWRDQDRADTGAARSWLQRALREIEVELSREVLRRFEALRLSLTGVLADAVDHGLLLA